MEIKSMPSNVDTRVSLALHPENVKKVAGYDDSTARYLDATEMAFSTAYEGLRAVHDARATAEKNPGWTPEQRAIQVSKFAEKKFDQSAKALDKARGDLEKNIAQVEAELTAPVEGRAGSWISIEIRAHVKAMPTTPERHAFIQQAIAGGDSITMGALLAAPAYLSGLTADLQTVYLRQHREVMAPELAQRLKAMQGAKTLIEERGGLIFKEIDKAVGAPPRKAAELQKAQNAALKALELT